MERARRERRPELADCFPLAALQKATDGAWRSYALRLYRNWLGLIAERKAALEASYAVAR
jgi:hypothetical protein